MFFCRFAPGGPRRRLRLKTDDSLSSQHELVFAVRQASVKELSARVWRWMRNVRRTSARCRS